MHEDGIYRFVSIEKCRRAHWQDQFGLEVFYADHRWPKTWRVKQLENISEVYGDWKRCWVNFKDPQGSLFISEDDRCAMKIDAFKGEQVPLDSFAFNLGVCLSFQVSGMSRDVWRDMITYCMEVDLATQTTENGDHLMDMFWITGGLGVLFMDAAVHFVPPEERLLLWESVAHFALQDPRIGDHAPLAVAIEVVQDHMSWILGRCADLEAEEFKSQVLARSVPRFLHPQARKKANLV